MTADLREAVTQAFAYFTTYSIPIPPGLYITARLKGISVGTKAIGDYSSIRDRLYDAVYNAVEGFLNSNAQAGTYSRPMTTALAQAYIDAGDAAYQDGGGSLPLDDETAAWARAELDAQFGFADSLFETLRALRREGDFDAAAEATARAENYTRTLDGFYNAVKLRGAGNAMLTWRLGETEKHCKDCLRLDGGRHRAPWYISHGYFPRKPGSNTECGGWRCDCMLEDDQGHEFTI